MRLQVLFDEQFNIIGTARTGEVETTEGPMTLELLPARGQQVVEVEVPDELAQTDNAIDLHRNLKAYIG